MHTVQWRKCISNPGNIYIETVRIYMNPQLDLDTVTNRGVIRGKGVITAPPPHMLYLPFLSIICLKHVVEKIYS